LKPDFPVARDRKNVPSLTSSHEIIRVKIIIPVAETMLTIELQMHFDTEPFV